MGGSIVSRSQGRARLKRATPIIAALAALVAGGLGIWFFVAGGSGVVPSPASVVASPVRAVTADGDRVYMMTSQWRTFRTRGTRNGTSYTRLFVDVWGFDATNAKPVWRIRVADDRGGVNMGRKLLGLHGGVLWLLDGKGLVGISPKDGSRIADASTLEAANPDLRDAVPSEERYVRFDPQGLSFTAADGRDWRLTGTGSATKPDGPRLSTDAQRAPPLPGVALPARNAGGNGSWAFYSRGLNIANVQWLGLLAEPEVETFRKNGAIGGVDPENHPRSRLWGAKIGKTQTFFGPKVTFRDFRPLPEGPEYLTAGLLQDGRCCHDTPILLFKPDSVLVLHKDRLGAEGKFRLTRASGPLGKPLWTVDLPLTGLEAVMPGETSVAIYGRRDEAPLFGREKRPESVDQLVTVDYATGRLAAYGFRIKATDPQDIPPSSTDLAAPAKP